MELSTTERLKPRLAHLEGKIIPYSKLWKILISLQHVYVEQGNRLSSIWSTRHLKRELVTVKDIYERTGLETSGAYPLITSTVVKIKVIG